LFFSLIKAQSKFQADYQRRKKRSYCEKLLGRQKCSFLRIIEEESLWKSLQSICFGLHMGESANRGKQAGQANFISLQPIHIGFLEQSLEEAKILASALA